MTASPATGQVASPPVPTVEGDSEEEKKKRRRKAILLLLLLGLLALLVLLTIWYLLFRQPINPLPPIPESQVPSYSTSIYGAERPTGVAVTPAGDLIYVTDTAGRVVRIYDGGGTEVGTMAAPPDAVGDFVPTYIAIDPLTSEVYVTDRATGEIFIYDSAGRYQRTFAAAEPIVGWQPLGIAFSKDGDLYVTDLGGASPTVRHFDRTAALVETLGAADGLDFPNGVAVGGDGRVWVTDSNNGRLFIFAPDGTVVAKAGRGMGSGSLGLPRGVAIDDQGRAFVVDSTGQGVVVYRGPAEGDARPEYLGSFGAHGIGNGEFSYPMGGAVDGRGRVYIADTANGRVQVWSY
jgi:DNA-binding beta-propeller fold protein YncE